MKSLNLFCAALCVLAPSFLEAASGTNYSEAAIANGAVDALQTLTGNSIIATNQPAASDSSLQGLSVGSQVNAEAVTNTPALATNLPSSYDQSVSGSSVSPSLASNPPAPPQGLNAGTNALPDLPAIPVPDLPTAPLITNPITPGSLPAPLPTTATGHISMPTAGTNDFGLSDKVTNIPLTAEALAKAGNKVIPGVIAKNAKKLTIDDAVQLALQKNPEILIAIDNIRKASGNYITVRAGLLPQFGVQQSAYSWIEPSFVNGQRPQVSSASPYAAAFTPNNQSWNIALQGNQLLYDGWKTPSLTSAAKLSEHIAYFQLRQTIDSTIAKIVQQFYQVVLDRALVIANEQQVAAYKTQVTDQQSRYDAGTVPRFNVLQAQVQLANGLSLTREVSERSIKGTSARAPDCSRRRPVIQASLPAKARAKGSIFRIWQQALRSSMLLYMASSPSLATNWMTDSETGVNTSTGARELAFRRPSKSSVSG